MKSDIIWQTLPPPNETFFNKKIIFMGDGFPYGGDTAKNL